jgi:hypothetical protein
METYRIQESAALYYLTFTVVYWLPVLSMRRRPGAVHRPLTGCKSHRGVGCDFDGGAGANRVARPSLHELGEMTPAGVQ